jgi:hypothetical protein
MLLWDFETADERRRTQKPGAALLSAWIVGIMSTENRGAEPVRKLVSVASEIDTVSVWALVVIGILVS